MYFLSISMQYHMLMALYHTEERAYDSIVFFSFFFLNSLPISVKFGTLIVHFCNLSCLGFFNVFTFTPNVLA